MKAHGRHGQLAQLALDLPLERGGGLRTLMRQLRCRGKRLLCLLCDQCLQLLQPITGIFDLIKTFADRIEQIDQPNLVSVIFSLQSPQQGQPRLDAVKFLIGKIQPVTKIAQSFRCILQCEHRSLDRLRQRREFARVVCRPLDLRQRLARQRGCGIVSAGQQIISQIDSLRELFEVAQQVAALGELRLFPSLELGMLQFLQLTAQTVGQQFFFVFVGRERVAFLAERLIRLILRLIAREFRL